MSARLVLAIGELEIGGTQRQMLELAKRLDRRAFTPEVLCLSRSLAFADEFERSGVPVTVVEKRSRYDISVIVRLRTFLRGSKILISFGFTADAWCRIAACLAGIPVVVSSVRTSNEESRLIDAVNRVLVPLTDYFIANSRAVGRYLENIGVPADKQSIIVNGFDMERISAASVEPASVRHSLGIPATNFVIGMVSRLSPEKNVEGFLRIGRAFCQACPETTLIVIGDGPEADRLKDLASEWKLDKHLRWLGERHDVPALLRGFDVAMLTSFREGLSNTLLEYMASGLPVIASDVGGNAEVIAHGRNGLLFPVDDVDGAAEHLLVLSRDTDLRRNLGCQARADVTSQFAMSGMITKTQELLLRLCHEKHQRWREDQDDEFETGKTVAANVGSRAERRCD